MYFFLYTDTNACVGLSYKKKDFSQWIKDKMYDKEVKPLDLNWLQQLFSDFLTFVKHNFVYIIRNILKSVQTNTHYYFWKAICRCIKPDISETKVPSYLLGHIQSDLRSISTVIGRSEENVLVLIHFLLAEIMNNHTQTGIGKILHRIKRL